TLPALAPGASLAPLSGAGSATSHVRGRGSPCGIRCGGRGDARGSRFRPPTGDSAPRPIGHPASGVPGAQPDTRATRGSCAHHRRAQRRRLRGARGHLRSWLAGYGGRPAGAGAPREPRLPRRARRGRISRDRARVPTLDGRARGRPVGIDGGRRPRASPRPTRFRLTASGPVAYDASYTRAPSDLAIVAIIPARFGSTRLPGKPLSEIHGKTLIERVHERVRGARSLDRVLVATDDERIAAAVRG